jgi:hypothetical protein
MLGAKRIHPSFTDEPFEGPGGNHPGLSLLGQLRVDRSQAPVY